MIDKDTAAFTVEDMEQVSEHRNGAPLPPVCECCGGTTRMVGLEPHPKSDTSDLLTYACLRCDAMQTVTMSRTR